MNIGLTYDLQTDPSDERQAEFDPPATLDALESSLRQLGHQVVRFGDALRLMSRREALKEVDLVFNIAEGSRGRCREAWVPILLEAWGVPFVGSSATAQALGLDKLMSRRLAASEGLRVARGWVMAAANDSVPVNFHFPAIVKPRYEGSGLGISPEAIVADESALRERVAYITKRFQQPCLVEEFIAFGELTVFLIGNQPPEALPVIQRPLDPRTRLSCHVAGLSKDWFCPVAITPALEESARGAAVKIFESLQCRDMARVDFRVDNAGQMYFLEINPLPSFAPDGSVGLLAEYLGMSYTQLIGRILDAAIERIGKTSLQLDQS